LPEKFNEQSEDYAECDTPAAKTASRKQPAAVPAGLRLKRI